MEPVIITEVIEKGKLPERLQQLCEQHGADTFIRKSFVEIKASELKEGERAEITYVSTIDIDRDGEVLLPSGCLLSEFRKAMQVLWGHNYKLPPIGSDQWIKIDSRGVLAKTIYAETARGEEIWQLVRQGHLKTSSVGFIPLKWVSKNDEGWATLLAREAKKGNNIDPEKCRRVYTKWLLLEHSKVSVPANINALTQSVAKGRLALSPDTLADLGIFDLSTKGVIPFHDYGKESEGTAWDAGAQVRQADVEALRKICAWFDSEHPDLKGAYKLPHHDAKSLKCNRRGTAAAIAVLLGAKDGVNVPAADKKGIYNHLVKDYKQFDKEPPAFREYSELEVRGLFAGEWKEVEEGIIDLEWLKTCSDEGWEDLGASLKPYPNEHSCRLHPPGRYSRFARNNNRFGDGIHAIFGRRKTDGKSELQAIRFDKTKFTTTQARKWLKDHDHKCILFEPATEQGKDVIVIYESCEPEPQSTIIEVVEDQAEKLKKETVKALNRAIGKV